MFLSRVGLNIDLGELPDEPDELYSLATQVNIACGGHAGDDASIARAVALARAAGATIAAHPSYPDRAGFGRTSMAIAPAVLGASIREQCARLRAHVGPLEVSVVKPHGALYHDLGKHPELARAFVDAVREVLGEPALVGPPGSPLASQGLRFLAEGFADRGYAPDGSLLARGTPGALIGDPALAAAAARRLMLRSDIDTICVHGDSPNALAVARAVRAALS